METASGLYPGSSQASFPAWACPLLRRFYEGLWVPWDEKFLLGFAYIERRFGFANMPQCANPVPSSRHLFHDEQDREGFHEQTVSQTPSPCQETCVKIKVDVHLDPDHKAFTLFEAPSAEAVRDFLVQGGFAHYVNMEFPLVTPIQDLIKQAQDMPTIY